MDVEAKHSALKRERPALQNMKFLNFFLFLWVIFVLLGPKLDSDFESASGSGSETDPPTPRSYPAKTKEDDFAIVS
jgi:hypothetical protein